MSDDEEERLELGKKKRDEEYLQFRREFDRYKQTQKGLTSDAEKLKVSGNQLFSIGCYVQAALLYSEALELQPDNAVLYCNRAMAYLKQGLADQALTDAEESIRLDGEVGNIKAYWRKAQALLDLERVEEAEATADAGLLLQPSNQHLNKVRRKARELTTLRKLEGRDWTGKLENGVEKRMRFTTEGILTISVFGHFIEATFDLSIEGRPRSMVVRMKPESMGAGPGNPPPPPTVYIFEFHQEDGEEELWLCHPVGSNELPTKFEGPGFERLRRVQQDEPGEDESEPLDDRCLRYMREMTNVMPLIPPQLPEKPSEAEVNEEVMRIERVSQLKRRFGLKVHQRAVELAKDPFLALPGSELADLSLALRRRFLARRILEGELEQEDALVAKMKALGQEPTTPHFAAPQASLALMKEGPSLNAIDGAPSPRASEPGWLGRLAALVCCRD